MTTYKIPQTLPAPLSQQNEVFLIASGDLRLSANQTCWPAQTEMERLISAAFVSEGITVRRAHSYIVVFPIAFAEIFQLPAV